jgi:hypothetical protein
VWHGDALYFASVLARFRLVAKLFAGRHDVAEFGFASVSGTRTVLPKVKQLRLFDPRERVIIEQQKQLAGDTNFRAALHDILNGPLPHDVLNGPLPHDVLNGPLPHDILNGALPHDILSGPLPRSFDSIYSTDFIQFISSDDEETFVCNLRDSLSPVGFLLVGCPTYYSSAQRGLELPLGQNGEGKSTSEPVPSQRVPLGLSGRMRSPGGAYYPHSGIEAGEPKIYYRTAEGLVAVLQHHFHAVFAFSLIDDIVIPGSHPYAQHAFALGCTKKISARRQV